MTPEVKPLAVRLQEAEDRAGEMEARYDRLTLDLKRNVERAETAEAEVARLNALLDEIKAERIER